MKILLACAMGLSTSILVQKMQIAAKEQEKNYKIWATDIDSIEDEEEEYDVVLVGPQVSFRLQDIIQAINDSNIPVEVIDNQDYGRCDGVAVLKRAEELACK